jgi:hypothetical protein
MTPRELLDLEIGPSDAGSQVRTVREYLLALLSELWREEEGFSGKRPFGNSGWQHDLYDPMARAGLVECDSDGYIKYEEYDKAEALVLLAIEALN